MLHFYCIYTAHARVYVTVCERNISESKFLLPAAQLFRVIHLQLVTLTPGILDMQPFEVKMSCLI